jgi:hypothetical protein
MLITADQLIIFTQRCKVLGNENTGLKFTDHQFLICTLFSASKNSLSVKFLSEILNCSANDDSSTMRSLDFL